MSEEESSPKPHDKIVSFDGRRQEIIRTEQTDQEPTEGEMILLNEGLDLLASFKTISDPKMRALVKTLVDGLAEIAQKSSG